MNKKGRRHQFIVSTSFWLVALLAGLVFSPSAQAFTLHVIDGKTNTPIAPAYRWMVEVDNTFDTVPGAAVTDQLSFAMHNSYAPIASLVGGAPAKGDEATGSAAAGVDVDVDPAGRYYISVLPNGGYAMGGAQALVGATDVYVYVEPYPLPTAQISVFAFKDHWPINNAPDAREQEPGLGGATLVVSDAAGPLWQDAYGNPLGTLYDDACLPDAFDPVTCVTSMGDGVLITLTEDDYCAALGYPTGPVEDGVLCDTTNPPGAGDPTLNPYDLMPGEALVKYLPPGKYGIVLIPPVDGRTYNLTSTIEGTPTVDAWIMSDEAQFFIEQFGAASPWHAFFGYVIPEELPWNISNPGGPGSISGQNRFNHFSRPPNNQSLDVGPPVENCWVGVNEGVAGDGQGLYVTQCAPDSTFQINGIPEGDYVAVVWDTPLDALFDFHPFSIPETIDENGNPIPPNYTLTNKTFLASRWFGTQKGNVFIDDSPENGFRDPGEVGLMDQAVLMRFRDGTIYQATATDPAGDYELTELFPFFKWLVTEVDFARYKATGMTAAVDMGGTIPEPNGWIMPSFGMLNPQPQTTDGSFSGPPIINPNTGNEFSRTETGEVLTQAVQTYLTQTNVIDWGKNFYGPGPDGLPATLDDENGGISGIVYYAVTRAEDDPKWAAAEEWEPGIPNVQLTLYHDDVTPYGRIDCLDNVTGDPLPAVDQPGCTPEIADVDNPPFGNFPGPEDIDHLGNSTFDYGDAVQITWTDSWNDSKPTGCVQDLPYIHGAYVNPCYDGYGTWNQVRDGVFDGGYAFGDHFERGMNVGVAAGDTPIPLQSGTYIVEAGTPHGYIQIREEDKNVDFGDEFIPSTQAEPPICVGEERVVPPYLSLWTDDAGAILPDVPFPPAELEAPYAGQSRPLCDRKQVRLTSGLNAAAEFFFLTKVPKAARGIGFINNDLAPEFNMASPAFGEKMSPSWLPVSLRDWNGREVSKTYSDEFGSYEFLVPGSYTVNQASPSGVTLAIYNIIINDPLMQEPNTNPATEARVADPFHSTDYTTPPWVFQFETGRTSYIDSPIVPTAAFVGYPTGQLDVSPADGVPVISSVSQAADPGALACTDGDSIVIASPGMVEVPNPDYDPSVAGSTPTIARDYGFGDAQGSGTVVLGGVTLAVTSWSNLSITAVVSGVPDGSADLYVTRDSGATNVLAASVAVGGCTNDLFVATSGVDDPASGAAGTPYQTIQYAIDQATAGDRIFVAAGTYNERVILYKEVSLLGSGSGTIINSRPSVQSLVQDWRDKLSGLGGVPNAATEVPGIMVTDPQGTFANGAPDVVIDGFKITGGTTGGGIYLLDHAYNAEISNNIITGNQGQLGGGITVGFLNTASVGNTGVHIHGNQITKNAGINGGGGIALYAGSTNYLVENNRILGNFSRGHGAGVSHIGTSDLGVIQANVIALNEGFYFAAGGGDGGGIYVGNDVNGDGAGSVIIDANLIKSNMSGSGYGGGIRINGLNVSNGLANTAYSAEIYNNMIVNNVAAIAGGGISLQDASNVSIINNTIANNDSTSTAQLAFPNTNLNPSAPRPAGIHANVHSAALAAALAGDDVPNPTLENNIVYQNRAYFHEGLNVGGNALSFSGYWDLGITGQAIPGTDALNPDYSDLTSLTGVNGEDYADGTNVTFAPSFFQSYFNTLQSAATLDEGGNNISVRFAEVDLTFGDYHLPTTSPLLEIGASVPVAPHRLAVDYDGDARPTGVEADIGADEVVAGAVPVLTLVAPSPGQVLVPGVTYTVSWVIDPNADNYRLYYFDADGTPHLVAAGVTGSTYAWTVPQDIIDEPGKRFRVTSFNGAAKSGVDWIDGPFTVVQGGGNVLTPNGGEVLVGDGVSTYTVTWTHNPAADSYRLRYADADGTLHVIANVANVTSYEWTVPTVGALESGKRVRIASFNGTTNLGVVDWSDADFAFVPSALNPGTLIYPNGGESLTLGSTYNVYWTPVPTAASYRLYYFDADGTAHFVKNVDTTSYAWTVPPGAVAEAGKRFRVTAFDAGGTNLGVDRSDLPFSMVNP